MTDVANTEPPVEPESNRGRMFGCWSWAVVVISCTKRSAPSSAASSGFRIFSATVRSCFGSWASIGTAVATSTIVSRRPFPNESPPLFSSWRDFFKRAAARSTALLGHPKLDVESHHVDEVTMCSVLPFRVGSVSLPDGPVASGQLKVGTAGSFTCPGRSLATLSF